MKIRRYRFPRPPFVADNVDSMRTIRNNCSISLQTLSAHTLIPIGLLQNWEARVSLPGKTNYNKLANFFDWEIWL